ncbi:MAG: TRAP transporter small permease [Desulfovibrio sp.]|nr:TRAP transporter small permease [Desulfovibrio sp.]
MWKFLDNHAEETFGALLLALMALIAFVNVIVRYCTTFSFAWTEELTVNFFVWAVLLGTACVFRKGGNLSMTVLYNVCPRRLRLCFLGLALALGVIFFGCLAYFGVLEVVDEYQLESTSESLGIPVWWYTLATPFFSLLIIFRMLQRVYLDLRDGTY